MIVELKTFRATCDQCGATKDYAHQGAYLPEGWRGQSREVVYGTGYYDHCVETKHLCPKCAPDAPKRKRTAKGAP